MKTLQEWADEQSKKLAQDYDDEVYQKNPMRRIEVDLVEQFPALAFRKERKEGVIRFDLADPYDSKCRIYLGTVLEFDLGQNEIRVYGTGYKTKIAEFVMANKIDTKISELDGDSERGKKLPGYTYEVPSDVPRWKPFRFGLH